MTEWNNGKMKTSRPAAAACIVLSAFIMLVIGWLIYPWLLSAVMAGSDATLSSPSVSALTSNRSWAALSFALLGAVTSGSILFFKRKTAMQAATGVITGLILIALASAAGWLFFIQRRIASVTSDLSGMASVSIENIPVYETGIFASIVVLLATLLFIVWSTQKQRT